MKDWLLRFWNDGASFERIARSILVAGTMYLRAKKLIDPELAALIVGGGLLIPVNGTPKTNQGKLPPG